MDSSQVFGTPYNGQDGGRVVVDNATTDAGSGSVGTRVRCFKNIVEESGDDVGYIKDPVLGDSFRIKRDGVYAVTWNDGPGLMAVTLDSDSLTAMPSAGILAWTHASVPPSTGFPFDYVGDLVCVLSAVTWLKSGSIIRAQWDGQALGGVTAFGGKFSISRVG